MVSAVRIFLLISIAYFSLAALVAPVFMNNGMNGFVAIVRSTFSLLHVGSFFLIGIVIGLGLLVLTVDRGELRRRLPIILYAFLASIFLHSGFTIMKNAMSFITPYFADPFLADLDRTLGFGEDSWRIAHRLGEHMPVRWALYGYLAFWSLPAFALPIVIAVTDGDRARMTRTLILYAVAWIFIGNVLALGGLSVGPVYYDRLLGGDRFADLALALQNAGVVDTNIGETQQALWDIYAGNLVAVGSGISAFPSVHVAIATVAALYMIERSRWLILPAAAFLISTFFLSVYTGYHYAVDGYVSIIVVFTVWWVLRRIMPS